MSVFADLASYYDLLYQDKDYAGEANYITSLLRRFAPDARSIVEYGSGTGRHAVLLAEAGYTVHGIELSEEMLHLAESLPNESNNPFFSKGDIRTARLGKTFGGAISLFHVMSYQTMNGDLAAAFSTVQKHLIDGGLFIFDCWYGPAVLTERPSVRIKRMSNTTIEVTRLAEPVMHPNDNIVDVNYQVFIRDLATGVVNEIHETHRMRYLFRPEIELLLNNAGFKIVHSEEWMTGKDLSFDTWGSCFVAQLMINR